MKKEEVSKLKLKQDKTEEDDENLDKMTWDSQMLKDKIESTIYSEI